MSGGKHTPLVAVPMICLGVSLRTDDKSRVHVAAVFEQSYAPLLEAAPDLLEALQLMLEQFTKTPSTLKDSEARIKAHAALSRATGSKS